MPPSVYIGGGNFNLGLEYLKQREREQAMALQQQRAALDAFLSLNQESRAQQSFNNDQSSRSYNSYSGGGGRSGGGSGGRGYGGNMTAEEALIARANYAPKQASIDEEARRFQLQQQQTDENQAWQRQKTQESMDLQKQEFADRLKERTDVAAERAQARQDALDERKRAAKEAEAMRADAAEQRRQAALQANVTKYMGMENAPGAETALRRQAEAQPDYAGRYPQDMEFMGPTQPGRNEAPFPELVSAQAKWKTAEDEKNIRILSELSRAAGTEETAASQQHDAIGAQRAADQQKMYDEKLKSLLASHLPTGLMLPPAGTAPSAQEPQLRGHGGAGGVIDEPSFELPQQHGGFAEGSRGAIVWDAAQKAKADAEEKRRVAAFDDVGKAVGTKVEEPKTNADGSIKRGTDAAQYLANLDTAMKVQALKREDALTAKQSEELRTTYVAKHPVLLVNEKFKQLQSKKLEPQDAIPILAGLVDDLAPWPSDPMAARLLPQIKAAKDALLKKIAVEPQADGSILKGQGKFSRTQQMTGAKGKQFTYDTRTDNPWQFITNLFNASGLPGSSPLGIDYSEVRSDDVKKADFQGALMRAAGETLLGGGLAKGGGQLLAASLKNAGPAAVARVRNMLPPTPLSPAEAVRMMEAARGAAPAAQAVAAPAEQAAIDMMLSRVK